MYKIYADDLLIYDDTSQDPYVKVASPRLTLEVNAAGSLKVTIPPGNAGYDYIVRMNTEIKVEKDGREYWSGRVLQESKDFWNNRALTCEGELAYLNDTSQPQENHSYTGQTCLRLYLKDLLDEHNAHTTTDKQFEIGVVTVYANSVNINTNYEKTIECVNKLIEEYGGYLQIRKSGGVRYLDWLEDGFSDNSQTIEFGKNLIDFTSSFDSTEYATVIVPLGAKQEEQEVEGLENYLTVEGSSLGDGTRYVKAAQEVLNAYGWIEKVVHWDDENNADNLYRLGQRYLSDLQFDTMVIELSAFDLHYLNSAIEDVKLGDRIRVVSTPHGIDHFFPVNKLDIPLDQPQNAKFTLGDDIKTSLTSANNKTNAEILEKLSQAPDIDEDAILTAAQENASALMNMTLNGYVTLLTEEDQTGRHSEGLYISQTMPLKDDQGNFVAQRFWKWTSTGLGYTDDGGQTWKAAITMDGTILGERIAAGSIHGSKITAGSLDIVTSSGQSGLSIGLSARGMAPGSFEIGDIQTTGTNAGKNAASTTRARSIYKTYLTLGSKVTLNSTSYWFEPIEYSDNDGAESGFVRAYGEPSDRTFTVTSTNYYRFVVRKTSSGTINQNELNTIAAAFDLGGTSAVITAADLQVIGMVRFTDLSGEGTTTINGANISTGYVTASHIDLKGLTIRNGDNDVTFSVSNTGDVFINGNVDLNENSMISFSQSSDKRLGDVALDAEDALDASEALAAIAEGTYTGTTIGGVTYTGSFINGTTIFSPTIIANNLIAQAPSGSTGTSGVIALRDSNGNDKLSIRYQSQIDAAPGVYFSTNTTGVYSFDKPIEIQGGITVGYTESANLPYSYIHGYVFMNADSELHIAGKTILTYGVNYVSNYNELPSNAQEGQICFVLN